MTDHMTWRIKLRSGNAALPARVPSEILTGKPRFRNESMPDEIGLLLPTNDGPRHFIDTIASKPDQFDDAMVGLFMANPFLNIPHESPRLQKAGIKWITNLPSVGQQDEDFSLQLSDVGLDHDRELECLAQFRKTGFKIAAVVTDVIDAKAAAAIEPDMLIVLPRVAGFAAGFPSSRQRGAAAQAASDAAGQAGWSGLLLGLGETRELDHERQWPDTLDGLVCRPVAR